MGSDNEKQKIMNEHEEEVMRIRNLERKDEQDAEIRRFIAENDFKIKEEEIERLREKDLQEYEIKNKELSIKEQEIRNQHEQKIKEINNNHEENIKKLDQTHEIGMKKLNDDYTLKTIDLDIKREQMLKENENKRILNEKLLNEEKNKGEKEIKMIENQMETSRQQHEELMKKQYNDTKLIIQKNDNLHEEKMAEIARNLELEKLKLQIELENAKNKKEEKNQINQNYNIPTPFPQNSNQFPSYFPSYPLYQYQNQFTPNYAQMNYTPMDQNYLKPGYSPPPVNNMTGNSYYQNPNIPPNCNYYPNNMTPNMMNNNQYLVPQNSQFPSNMNSNPV